MESLKASPFDGMRKERKKESPPDEPEGLRSSHALEFSDGQHTGNSSRGSPIGIYGVILGSRKTGGT